MNGDKSIAKPSRQNIQYEYRCKPSQPMQQVGSKNLHGPKREIDAKQWLESGFILWQQSATFRGHPSIDEIHYYIEPLAPRLKEMLLLLPLRSAQLPLALIDLIIEYFQAGTGALQELKNKMWFFPYSTSCCHSLIRAR
jgi:hypothetical protein